MLEINHFGATIGIILACGFLVFALYITFFDESDEDSLSDKRKKKPLK